MATFALYANSVLSFLEQIEINTDYYSVLVAWYILFPLIYSTNHTTGVWYLENVLDRSPIRYLKCLKELFCLQSFEFPAKQVHQEQYQISLKNSFLVVKFLGLA